MPPPSSGIRALYSYSYSSLKSTRVSPPCQPHTTLDTSRSLFKGPVSTHSLPKQYSHTRRKSHTPQRRPPGSRRPTPIRPPLLYNTFPHSAHTPVSPINKQTPRPPFCTATSKHSTRVTKCTSQPYSSMHVSSTSCEWFSGFGCALGVGWYGTWLSRGTWPLGVTEGRSQLRSVLSRSQHPGDWSSLRESLRARGAGTLYMFWCVVLCVVYRGNVS
ncbi:uncharacterized protein M421DRAFT_142134 [Didymella exigua CBS 183.55]|uniref:Uncharacterized protein n=1 Tax=Didymella exigua CBS 183.55 TaxID=1150837 RepID=A0A6A5RRH5_9PLEO|nr:uncharacterized protein M421DRAFT_142134 [Didymella exigua CBS 183.55]KAF1928896.1 hypothetical protein M421DRAFT_142134 [Didymella exigua CBS 183.55]